MAVAFLLVVVLKIIMIGMHAFVAYYDICQLQNAKTNSVVYVSNPTVVAYQVLHSTRIP